MAKIYLKKIKARNANSCLTENFEPCYFSGKNCVKYDNVDCKGGYVFIKILSSEVKNDNNNL